MSDIGKLEFIVFQERLMCSMLVIAHRVLGIFPEKLFASDCR